jgi:hypothetical protein
LLYALLAGLFAGLVGPRLFSAQAAPVMQAATNVVISEFRTRGPNGGNDEFIELYNPTITPINISGWEIWGSNSSGTINLRATIPTVPDLQPGQHYLVANTNASGGYSGAYDHNYTSGITNDGGIALIRPDIPTPTVIDQVGMNTGSAYKEGTPLAPLPSDTDQSYERIYDSSFNCNDSNDNATDFFLRNPSDPQTSSSPVTTCGNPTSTPSPTNTATNTSTATNTGTPTPTGSATLTPTRTATPGCATSSTNTPLALIINEVAWAGTAASSDDEWIELYNPPGGVGCVLLDGWVLRAEDGTPTIDLSGHTIQDGGYFLLERGNNSVDDNTVSNITADLIYTSDLLVNTGERLYLENNGVRIDSANTDGGSWPAGSTSFRSMERRAVVLDSSAAWVTFNGGTSVQNGFDAGIPSGCTPGVNCSTNPRRILGTPRRSNWFLTITPTRTRTPVPNPTRIRTATPRPVGRPIINEYLPRPGFDWNQDGIVDVFDEFIEVMNIGPVDINIGGWRLDDEEGIGSSPFTIPSMILRPGQRVLFYGKETNILLSDGGDTVRLINSNGQVWDAHTYTIAKVPDRSWCRLPDGTWYWFDDCIPTPNLFNTRSGDVPAEPPDDGLQPEICHFPDTMPSDFIIAECHGYGSEMWRSMYWDEKGWQGDQFVPENTSKWNSFVE